MKKIILFICVFAGILFGQDLDKENNNYFDDDSLFYYKPHIIEVCGEVENPGYVNFSTLGKRSLLYKESAKDDKNNSDFIGAYWVTGYSLFDILNKFKLKKNNKKVFHPETDVYIEITNSENEKIVVSWGEVYFTSIQHQIILSTEVQRIIPVKSKDYWPVPEKSQLIFSRDFYNFRKITEPVKIEIKSYSGKVDGEKGFTPIYVDQIKLFFGSEKLISEFSDENLISYLSCFYGHGMGFHGFDKFTGVKAKDALSEFVNVEPDLIKSGYILISAKDGYRSIYSVAEIFNRNDNNEFLFIKSNDENEGKYFLFPGSDFFSDRALRSIEYIKFLNTE